MPNAASWRRRFPLVWFLFGLKGRISRGLYWLGYAFLFFLQGALIFQFMGSPELALALGVKGASFYAPASALASFLIPVTLYSNIALAAKRLHDVGYSGLIALAVLVPLLNVFFAIWVGILPGTPGPNAYDETGDSAA